MTEATFSSFLNAASIDDTVINNAGGPVGNTNAALQATAGVRTRSCNPRDGLGCRDRKFSGSWRGSDHPRN